MVAQNMCLGNCEQGNRCVSSILLMDEYREIRGCMASGTRYYY